MPRSALPRLLGRRQAKHRKVRGDPVRAVVAAPVVLVAALAVGAIAYAASGGFSSAPGSDHPGALGPTTSAVPPSTSSRQPSSSASPTTSTTSSSTTTTVARTTTSESTTTSSSTTTTTVPPLPVGAVSVEVLNGTGAPGEAGSVAGQLTSIGFDVIGTTDAANFGYATTIIEYAPGHKRAAATLARYLDGTVEYEASNSESGNAVTLIIGASLQSVAS